MPKPGSPFREVAPMERDVYEPIHSTGRRFVKGISRVRPICRVTVAGSEIRNAFSSLITRKAETHGAVTPPKTLRTSPHCGTASAVLELLSARIPTPCPYRTVPLIDQQFLEDIVQEVVQRGVTLVGLRAEQGSLPTVEHEAGERLGRVDFGRSPFATASRNTAATAACQCVKLELRRACNSGLTPRPPD